MDDPFLQSDSESANQDDRLASNITDPNSCKSEQNETSAAQTLLETKALFDLKDFPDHKNID